MFEHLDLKFEIWEDRHLFIILPIKMESVPLRVKVVAKHFKTGRVPNPTNSQRKMTMKSAIFLLFVVISAICVATTMGKLSHDKMFQAFFSFGIASNPLKD